MKNILIFLSLALTSCATTKFQDNEYEDIYGFTGVKSVTFRDVNNFRAVPDTTVIILDLNKKGNAVKQTDFYKQWFDVTYLKYNDRDLVVEEATYLRDTLYIFKNVFEYEGKNLISYTSLDKDGKTTFRKELKYDRKNNAISVRYQSSDLVMKEYQYTVDYKERSVLTPNINTPNDNIVGFKVFYNTKGLKWKLGNVDRAGEFHLTTEYLYDKNKNVTQHKIYRDDALVRTNIYKYYYNNKNNVIKREKYEDNKLVKTLLCELRY